MARPVKVKPEEVNKAVDDMIEAYEERGEMPTDYILRKRLGGSDRTLHRWYDGFYDKEDGESGTKTYQEAMLRLVEFRRHICVEGIANGGNKVTGWIFLSKQKLWGGFQDSVQRVENNGKQNITISIAGSDGKPLRHGK